MVVFESNHFRSGFYNKLLQAVFSFFPAGHLTQRGVFYTAVHRAGFGSCPVTVPARGACVSPLADGGPASRRAVSAVRGRDPPAGLRTSLSGSRAAERGRGPCVGPLTLPTLLVTQGPISCLSGTCTPRRGGEGAKSHLWPLPLRLKWNPWTERLCPPDSIG